MVLEVTLLLDYLVFSVIWGVLSVGLLGYLVGSSWSSPKRWLNALLRSL